MGEGSDDGGAEVGVEQPLAVVGEGAGSGRRMGVAATLAPGKGVATDAHRMGVG